MNKTTVRPSGAADLLVARFEAYGRSITSAEREVLERSVDRVETFSLGADVVRENEVRTESNLLLDGWACRYSDLSDGRRQILALHVAGDFVDLHSYQLRRMDHSVRAMTPCTIAFVPHQQLTWITETQPHLTRQLWLSTLIDAAIMRQWMLGLGRRSSLENAAHLFCELFYRLRSVGLTRGPAFTFPLNQTELGEALGITPVHTNRVLQELRAQGLMTLRGHAAEIIDLARLEALAEFDPVYLHLQGEAAPDIP